MKHFKWFIGLLLILLTACATSEKSAKEQKKKDVDLKKDKSKYEVIVTDPGFEQWFTINSGSAQDHPEQYYKNWNKRYVIAWNNRVMSGYYPSLFTNTIDYDADKDYGFEVERKLYYYFRWVETEVGIPILDYRRPAGIL